MTEPENASESTSLESLTGESAALQSLREEVRTLRSLFNAAAMALLLLSFGINAYLYYQDRVLRRDLDAAKKMAQEFETVRRPMVSTFITQLQDFARSHPDINPILDKYGIRPAASAPAPTPSPAKNPPAD
jgi:glutamate/tyrosine decarboxylase-like PLP-dependent enzyme